MKKIIYWVAAFLCMACSDDHGSNQENGGASGSVTEVTPVTSDLSVDLSTDKAFYKPGEKVVFTADDALPAGTVPSGEWYRCDCRYDCGRCIQ